MAQRIRFEHRAILGKLGKRISGAFVCQRGERGESFELAHSPQPFGDRRTVRGVPAIDRHRELRPQKERVGNRSEHQVVRRIEPRHE